MSRLSACAHVACAVAAAAVAVVPPVWAQAGAVIYGGARSGSGFRSADADRTPLHLRTSGAASLALEAPYDASRHWQLFVSHQRTRLALGTAASPGTPGELPLRLIYLHAGGVNYFAGPAGHGPYVSGGLGVTHLSPELPGTRSRVRGSLALGIGHEWALAGSSLALRLELRAYATLIGSEGAFFCSGGCTVAIRGDTLTQTEAMLGLRFGF